MDYRYGYDYSYCVRVDNSIDCLSLEDWEGKGEIMNQREQDFKESYLNAVFLDGIPKYEYKITKHIAHCSKCRHRFYKKDVRLRVITPYTTLILCPVGECAEWFFKELLKHKEDTE